MATSEYLAKATKPASAASRVSRLGVARRSTSQAAITAMTMMTVDALAVLFALSLALILRFDGPMATWWSKASNWPARLLPIYAGYLIFFIVMLLVINRRHGLYGPLQRQSGWHELRRTVQACFTAGLLLCGGMYVMHDSDLSRAVVAYLITFTTLFLCILRVFWRHSLYRRYKLGLDSKNVLIVGPNQVGNMLRKRIAGNTYLGRTFKGYVESASSVSLEEAREATVGRLDQIENLVRQHFVDEIILAERCETSVMVDLVDIASTLDVELLVVPGCYYEELVPESPIEFLGDFPVVALHRRNGRALALYIKRVWDFVVSAILLLLLSPTLLVVALLIKLDSSGPVFYKSERVGKKGRIFSCFKFRTMVFNAEELRASLIARNERDGVLFKIKDDPRVTRVGRILRKFSFDEIPQLLNVLHGDMSLVGPRPPLASEVQCYELQHLRRLEVLPGLTGLWQVRARQDPSFERYVGLDLAYVENWSFWLDLKILARTAEVVFRGTGS